MKKELIIIFILLGFILLVFAGDFPSVTEPILEPDLDISYFDNYNVSTNITNTSEIDTVQVNVSVYNGEGVDCWEFYANGSCANGNPVTYDMTFDSGTTWKKTTVRPDTIYPQIQYGSDSLFIGNSQTNYSTNKFSYHLMHFTNNFSMVSNTSLWIEISATPEDTSLSKDLVIYLVERNNNSSYFSSEWRNNDGVEIVGSRKSTDEFDHSHGDNSSH